MARKLTSLFSLCLIFSLAAAADVSFYTDLLDRGKKSFDAGTYQKAAKELRIAAFGLLDSLASYETALMYLALAQHRLGNDAEAAAAVRRLLDAERVMHAYQVLPVDLRVRQSFEELARRVLRPEELALLAELGVPERTARTEPPAQPQEPPAQPRRPPRRPAPAVARGDLAAADEALRRGDLERAHALYSQLLHSDLTDRDTLLQVARGLYQTEDFLGAVQAFSRVGSLRPGEEPYHYYAAVALFEAGYFAAAKKQLVCALPYIEVTDDVARYEAKIEAAVE